MSGDCSPISVCAAEEVALAEGPNGRSAAYIISNGICYLAEPGRRHREVPFILLCARYPDREDQLKEVRARVEATRAG